MGEARGSGFWKLGEEFPKEFPEGEQDMDRKGVFVFDSWQVTGDLTSSDFTHRWEGEEVEAKGRDSF